MYKTLLFVVFVAAGCGQPKDWNLEPSGGDLPPKQLNSSLWHYVEEFKADADAYNVSTSLIKKLRVLKYDEIDGASVVGRCTSHYSRSGVGAIRYTEIVIEPHMSNSRCLRALMYHELGHCVFKRDHREQDGLIMSDTLSSCSYFIDNWEYLLDRFFLDR